MKKENTLWIPQAIASVMLLVALNPENPYGYYILLRWVVCGIFAYLAFRALEQEKTEWVWALGITAAIYNPFIHIRLGRETLFDTVPYNIRGRNSENLYLHPVGRFTSLSGSE